GLFIERFPRPENNGTTLGIYALFLITSSDQVGRKLRSKHFKTVPYRFFVLLEALLAAHSQHTEIRRYCHFELFCLRSKRTLCEWSQGGPPSGENIRVGKIETFDSGGNHAAAFWRWVE